MSDDLFLVGDDTGLVKLYNIYEKESILTIQLNDTVTTVAFSPDRYYLFIGTWDG